MCDMASDDIGLVDGSTQQLALNSDPYAYWYKNYTWQAPIYPIGSYQIDYDWNSMYNTITYCNVIINEVPAVTNGTEADKNALIAEALVHRADAYLMLLNSYAKPYNATTASSDLGVPLVLVQTTTQPLVRESVQRVYEQIISDLKKALFSLPATQLFNTLPSKPSAYGELARCYLSMNDYSNASIYADSALLTRSTLNDMSNMTTISTYPLRKSDPEILLSKIAYGGISTNTPSALRLSDDLLSLLGTSDKRYLLFTAAASIISSTYTTAGGRFFYRDKALNESRNIGPSVPEMMLIKAEYYARKNDVANAMLWVNKIRIKRFATADYAPLTATDQNDALSKVIQERRREFFCRMLRWWDMRRLKDETLFKKPTNELLQELLIPLSPQVIDMYFL